MSRFYFHVYDGAQHFDLVGVMCDDDRAARRHMLIVAIAELLAPNAPCYEHWCVEAHDERGAIIGTMDFGHR